MLNRAFVVLCFSVFIASIGAGIITPILPIYINNLGASGFTIGVIFASFSFSMAILTPFIGRSSDKIGKRLYIIWGFAFSTVIAFAYIWVTTPSQLILVRFLNGISIAMILPISMAYIGDLTPRGAEGSYMGVYSMSMFLGMATGPVLGGNIVDKFGIAPAFYAFAGGMGVAFLVTMFLLPPQSSTKPTTIAKSPWKEILASGPLKGLFVFGFILAIAQSGLMVFLPLLAKNQDLSMSQIGILASIFILSAGIMQAPFGWLANHWNRVKLVICSTLLIGIGLVFLPLAHGFLPLLCLGAFLGLAAALGVPAANAMIVEHSRKIGLGVVTGSFNASNSVGNIIGPIAAGIVMDIININYAFYLIATIFIVGTIIFYYFTKGIILPSHLNTSLSKEHHSGIPEDRLS